MNRAYVNKIRKSVMHCNDCLLLIVCFEVTCLFVLVMCPVSRGSQTNMITLPTNFTS